MKRSPWPLLFIAAPAAVAIWSGWVGLGQMAGFGTIQPLPGIAVWHLDTAITLPVGIEAYGAYALGAWLSPGGVPAAARRFARRSAVGALLLGMTGQVVFHLLSAAHASRAPWPVVVLVSCVPVVTLGFAAALTHLLRSAPADAPGTRPDAPASGPALNGHAHPDRTRPVSAAEREFRGELAAGVTPSLRQVQRRMHVGQDKARCIRADLEQAGREGMAMVSNGSGPR